MGAPNGNFNAANDRSFISALNRAIAQDDGVRLRMIAEKLLDKASDGELMAINMVADRLDGKPKQQIDLGNVEDKPFKIVTTVELVALDGIGTNKTPE